VLNTVRNLCMLIALMDGTYFGANGLVVCKGLKVRVQKSAGVF